MSDLRIALIAEGITDQVIIEAALKAILPRPFVLTLLQPESTRPELGGGWGGVLKWCRDFCARGFGSIESDPTLSLYDFVVIHLDADVAEKSYANYGEGIEQESTARQWTSLPCPMPCPPVDDAVFNVKNLLLSWLGIPEVGAKTVLCIPSKTSESWLAAAVFPENGDLLAELECDFDMAGKLSRLPLAQRIKKSKPAYMRHANRITNQWAAVRVMCSQADVFHRQVLCRVPG